MPFDQTAWDNIFYSHTSGNVAGFNVLFSEFIERIAPNEEKYQAAVSILESYFYGGQRNAVFDSVCALRRLHPDSPKISAMLLAVGIETGRWDIVISVVHRNLKQPPVREALISTLAVWWPNMSERAPDIFRELLCRVILDTKLPGSLPDHLIAFAEALSGFNVSAATLSQLADKRYGSRAIALVGHIYQEQYRWTKALEIWSDVAILEPDFPDIEQLVARAIRNLSGSFLNSIEILADYADRPRIQQSLISARFHNFVLIGDRKATYRLNPKVGSTAILSKIWIANGGGTSASPDGVHDDTEILIRLDSQPLKNIEEIITSPEWLRFSFVRHPIRRFSSAFLNKCTRLHIALYAYAPFLKAIGLRSGIPTFSPIQTRDDYRIEDVLTFTELHAPQDLDPHFAPQTCVLNTAEIGYGFIGRMENFNRDLDEISGLIRVDLSVRQESLHRTNSEQFIDEAMDESIQKRLKEYFKQDMLEFNYT